MLSDVRCWLGNRLPLFSIEAIPKLRLRKNKLLPYGSSQTLAIKYLSIILLKKPQKANNCPIKTQLVNN
jgi:hypothetical protein